MEKNLTQWLRSELKERGISLRELSRQSGIHHSLLSRLIRGRVAPTPGLLQRLAPALDVPLPELLRAAGLPTKIALEETLADMGLGDGLNEARLSAVLGDLLRTAASPAGPALILREFPIKRKETALRGHLLDCLDQMFAYYRDGKLDECLHLEIGAALLYFITPHDCIPDDHFPFGYLDDALVIAKAWQRLPRALQQKSTE